MISGETKPLPRRRVRALGTRNTRPVRKQAVNSRRSPKGLDYNIGYNPTEFIAQSVHELIKTIYEAMALVVMVVLVFLQGWRPAIIPIIAIRCRWSAPSR